MLLKTARIFNIGGSQAVRLPAEFRFEGDEVFVRRDPRTGDIILSKKSGWTSWKEYFDLRDKDVKVPREFTADRPSNSPLSKAKLF